MESNVWVVGEKNQWEFRMPSALCPLPSALWARDGIGESRDRAGSWGGGLVGHGQITAAEAPPAYSAPMQNKCLSPRM